MHVPVFLFNRLKGQRVVIECVEYSTSNKTFARKYEGTFVGDANTGYDMFIELDTGDFINTKYIVSISIVQ